FLPRDPSCRSGKWRPFLTLPDRGLNSGARQGDWPISQDVRRGPILRKQGLFSARPRSPPQSFEKKEQMAAYDYDLFVIGAGSGGVRAARLAAISGARVAIAEEHRVGGTCVIRGCVPKKFMVYASEVTHQLEVARGFGWEACESPVFNWKTFLERKDFEIARLSGIYVRNLSNAGAEMIHGRAELRDAHTLEIAGKGQKIT